MKNGKKGKGHGHPWIIGVAGIIMAVVLFVKMPGLKAVTGTVLAFALAHIVAGLIALFSAYLVIPHGLASRFNRKLRQSTSEGTLCFGWSYGWMNIYWILCLIFLASAVLVFLADPGLAWLSFILLLFAFQFFAGNITLRISKKQDYMTLPAVDLLSSGSDLILDAGCGSGRTTVELSKVMKQSKIVALDRFDSDYIEGGGKALLDRNLVVAGIRDRVESVQGDITELIFADGHFDTAISSYMMDHPGHYKFPALKEVQRVLKPGGVYFLLQK